MMHLQTSMAYMGFELSPWLAEWKCKDLSHSSGKLVTQTDKGAAKALSIVFNISP